MIHAIGYAGGMMPQPDRDGKTVTSKMVNGKRPALQNELYMI